MPWTRALYACLAVAAAGFTTAWLCRAGGPLANWLDSLDNHLQETTP